jgi:hypothetical protein
MDTTSYCTHINVEPIFGNEKMIKIPTNVQYNDTFPKYLHLQGIPFGSIIFINLGA